MDDVLNPTLSALPNRWTEVNSPIEGRFWQMWLPGAFGDRAPLVTRFDFVTRFVVEDDEWDQREDGIYRTIKKARVTATAARLP